MPDKGLGRPGGFDDEFEDEEMNEEEVVDKEPEEGQEEGLTVGAKASASTVNNKEGGNDNMKGLNVKGEHGPSEGGLAQTGMFYDEPIMILTSMGYEDITDFVMDTIQEVNPVKVVWERFNYSRLTKSIRADSETAIDTISKITGAKYNRSQGGFEGGFDDIPILVFDERDVVIEESYDENLGGISRKSFKLDFSKIQNKNKKYFPKYGMVTSHDKTGGLIRVHLNIINVLISALGYEPSDFGPREQQDKKYLYPKQNSKSEHFRIAIVENKFYDRKIEDLLVRI